MRRTFPASRAQRAFTLIELLMIVVILGIVAAITVPQTSMAMDDARTSAFGSDIKIYERACQVYYVDWTAWPVNSASGVMPPELAGYVRSDAWADGTPIGGSWDFETGAGGTSSAVGVHFNGVGTTRDAAFMAGIDAMLDDGDLATGMFQQLDTDAYYIVLDP